MLSGYLMAKKSEKPLNGTLGEDSWKFIIHKIKGFYPMYLLAVVFNLICRYALTDYAAKADEFRYYVWDLLMLRVAGLHGETMPDTVVGATWYLMAMILAMAVLYPMLRANKDVFLHIIAPLLSVFLYGWFSQLFGKIYWSLDFYRGVCLGLLRAIAGISLGCVIYLVCQRLKAVAFKRIKLIQIIATAVELYIAVFIITTSIQEKNGQIDFICVLLEAVLLVIEFGGFSLINEAVKNWRIGWIGNFTMALFLCHFTWVYVLVDLDPDWPRGGGLTVYFGAAILTAIGFVWIMKGIRRLLAWAKARNNTSQSCA